MFDRFAASLTDAQLIHLVLFAPIVIEEQEGRDSFGFQRRSCKPAGMIDGDRLANEAIARFGQEWWRDL